MDICVICGKDTDIFQEYSKLGEKGSQGINAVSEKPGGTLKHQLGSMCIKSVADYVNVNQIQKTSNKGDVASTSKCNVIPVPTLRSKQQFSFSDQCLFCGPIAKNSKRK